MEKKKKLVSPTNERRNKYKSITTFKTYRRAITINTEMIKNVCSTFQY